MNLLPAFVPAAAVLLSITAAVAGSSGAAGRSGRVLRLPSSQAPLLKQAFRHSLVATPQEIVAQMRAFRSGQRDATVMDRIAKGYSDAEIEAIADWYQAQR